MLVTVTSAPGTAAPVGSVTFPSIRLVLHLRKSECCANAKRRNEKFFIVCVPLLKAELSGDLV